MRHTLWDEWLSPAPLSIAPNCEWQCTVTLRVYPTARVRVHPLKYRDRVPFYPPRTRRRQRVLLVRSQTRAAQSLRAPPDLSPRGLLQLPQPPRRAEPLGARLRLRCARAPRRVVVHRSIPARCRAATLRGAPGPLRVG